MLGKRHVLLLWMDLGDVLAHNVFHDAFCDLGPVFPRVQCTEQQKHAGEGDGIDSLDVQTLSPWQLPL